nr:23 kDa jasmonate-induced protein-like [Ziziphus jujuba var. spinosa]
MPEYQDKKVITAVDKAYEALMMKDADNKAENARKFVEGLKPKYGAALISTVCLIYNATGNRLTFIGSHDWEGHIGDYPYPLLLENGQWGAFLHVQTSLYGGSIAATVYRCQDETGDFFDWMLSWYNRRNGDDNRVYTEIREADQFNNYKWETRRFLNHYSSDMLNGCFSTVITGFSDVIDSDYRISPIFEGIITLKDTFVERE